jgi:hypothetical protein
MGYSLFDGSALGECCHFEGVECIRGSAKALFVTGLKTKKAVWVPLSQIQEDSEVTRPGEKGTLIVTEWFAEKAGLLESTAAAAPKTKPVDTRQGKLF